MQPSLEQTLEKKVKAAEAAVKLKYFKEFCNAKPAELDEIWAKMSALNSVVFELIKAIRKPE